MNNNYLIKTLGIYDAVIYDDKYLAYVGRFKKIVTIDNGEWKYISKMSYASRLCISDDEKILAIKATTGHIEVYSLEDCSLICKSKSTSNDGSNILFTKDNKYILDASWNGHISLINTNSGELNTIYKEENCMITSIEYDHYNDIYNFVLIYKMSNRQSVLQWKYPFDKNDINVIDLDDRVYAIRNILYNSNNSSYIAYSSYGIYYGNDLSSIATFKRINIESETISYASWSASGEYIFIADTEFVIGIRYPSFEEIFKIPLRFSCFVRTFINDKYICFGSWNSGYVYMLDNLI